MKIFAIVIFDNSADMDFSLIWDIFSRNKIDWKVKILGTKTYHKKLTKNIVRELNGRRNTIDPIFVKNLRDAVFEKDGFTCHAALVVLW